MRGTKCLDHSEELTDKALSEREFSERDRALPPLRRNEAINSRIRCRQKDLIAARLARTKPFFRRPPSMETQDPSLKRFEYSYVRREFC